MIPIVQFDPSTLAIWTSTSLLPPAIASRARLAMDAAMKGDDPAVGVADLTRNNPLRAKILWLASAVWHEKRHFFDTCLTNYGARRFRHLFNLAINFIPLLKDVKSRGEPVWFPVELYANDVRRKALGLVDPSPVTLELGRLARRMKQLTSRMDIASSSGSSVVHLGGEDQMEGLAHASQIHAVEQRFGLHEMVPMISGHVHQLPLDGPYRTIEAVSAVLGCSHEIQDGHIAVNPALAGALFVTALCGRSFGSESMPTREPFYPWVRFANLVEALGPKPGSFYMSDEEAWQKVERAAKKLWGRGVIEEIEADIDGSALMFSELRNESDQDLAKVYSDFIKMRRNLLAAVRTAGPTSLLPRTFAQHWADRLTPLHVVATPGGDFSEGGAPVVFGMKLKIPNELAHVIASRVSWGRIQTYSSGASEANISPRENGAWMTMLEQYGPVSHLMLNGRRHRRMLPPELERPIAFIEDLNIPVRFDPQFEWPEQRSNAVRQSEAEELASFLNLDDFTCDISGDKIRPSEASVLTPWELRRSPLLKQFQKLGLVSEIILETDWSDWVVKSSLLV